MTYFAIEHTMTPLHIYLIWSIKMCTGLSSVIQSVYWPIIGHLYCMTAFYRYYKQLICRTPATNDEKTVELCKEPVCEQCFDMCKYI